MRKQLLALEESGTPIRVALIGAGRFGTMVMAQVLRVPGMHLAVACDRTVERAQIAFRRAGYPQAQVVTTERPDEARDAIRTGRCVATADPDLALLSEVDVVVEATGDPEVGTRHALQAITAGKHIVMVNVEADVLVGPVLKRLADGAGIVYTLAYGDQPALIEELYDWAVSLGFEVVAAGKGTKYLPEYRKGTPEEALIRYGYSPADMGREDLNPQMYNSFLDGTKSAIEMCAVANMTGLVPDVPGMHLPPAGVSDLPHLLRPEEEGGILSRKGVVEVVSCLRPDGSEIPDSLRWGVFVVLTSDSPYLLQCLREYGMAMDDTGRYGVMYRPYHLVGMEVPVSIARAVLYGEPTGAPQGRVAEVVARAKRRLTPGEVLDGEGGYTVYGSVVEASQADRESLLPMGLCRGARIIRPVAEDQFLGYEDVALPQDSLAYALRKVQDAISTGVTPG
jgi:predicted homoserine dehydrogenase-like protein